MPKTAKPLPDDGDRVELLTGQQAAAFLGIDFSTLRRMNVPFVRISRVKRYTRASLRAWVERSLEKCLLDQQSAPAPAESYRGKNTSGKGLALRSIRSSSQSPIVEFEKVAGLRTKPQRQP